MGVDNCYVAGNSMGGKIAMELAMLDPERVRAHLSVRRLRFQHRPMLRLVKVLRPELGWRWATSRASREGNRSSRCFRYRWARRCLVRGGNRRLLRFGGARGRAAPSLRRLVRSSRGAPWRRGLLHSIRVRCRHRRCSFTASRTRSSPTTSAARSRRTLPLAEVQVWPDCGHVPQIEHPDRTAELMLTFLAQAGENERRADVRILFFGGTQFVGRHIVDHAIAAVTRSHCSTVARPTPVSSKAPRKSTGTGTEGSTGWPDSASNGCRRLGLPSTRVVRQSAEAAAGRNGSLHLRVDRLRLRGLQLPGHRRGLACWERSR